MPVPRVVLDTSTVIMPITRPESSHRWLMDAWQDGQIKPLISQQTQEELLRVMHNPRFQIADEMIQPIANQYLEYCETVVVPNPPPVTPVCRDPKDQKFVELAQHGSAQYLVSFDGDLLGMTNQMDESGPEGGFLIVRPAELFATIQLHTH